VRHHHLADDAADGQLPNAPVTILAQSAVTVRALIFGVVSGNSLPAAGFSPAAPLAVDPRAAGD